VKNIFLTGSSGFVGGAIFRALKNVQISILSRHPINDKYNNCVVVQGDLQNLGTNIFKNNDVVIHCAAQAHVTNEKTSKALDAYRNINTDGTIKLAQQAEKSGVKRFIFLSSIKVNGDISSSNRPFSEIIDKPPVDPYGQSKYEAELKLLDISKNTNMEVVIIRPPLVYGPSVKGNFASIINLVKKQYPLPVSLIKHNKRSLIALDNLVDFILLCADYEKTPQAANQIFVVSDNDDVSTAKLFRRVASSYNKKSRLFPFPVYLLRLCFSILGKREVADRLLGSLQVDSTKARELLGWEPVITMDEQLNQMAVFELNT